MSADKVGLEACGGALESELLEAACHFCATWRLAERGQVQVIAVDAARSHLLSAHDRYVEACEACMETA